MSSILHCLSEKAPFCFASGRRSSILLCLSQKELHFTLSQSAVRRSSILICCYQKELHSTLTQKELHSTLPHSEGAPFFFDSEWAPLYFFIRSSILLLLRRSSNLCCLSQKVLHSALTQKDLHSTLLLSEGAPFYVDILQSRKGNGKAVARYAIMACRGSWSIAPLILNPRLVFCWYCATCTSYVRLVFPYLDILKLSVEGHPIVVQSVL